jgi:hypothetical protein
MIPRRPHVVSLFVCGAFTVGGCGADAGSSTRDRVSARTASATCSAAGSGVVAELALAKCLARADSLAPRWPTLAANKPVSVYIDRSGSMAGFLKPGFSGDPRSYAVVIDKVILALSPQRKYGFGSQLVSMPNLLERLPRPEMYTDNNTLLEATLDSVASDTGHHATHLIVGDGRRSTKGDADAQYVRMRTEAARWVQGGGTFVVAASRAPFERPRNDPAGCRTSGNSLARCPLYAFAFVAPGDETRVVGALTDAFDHVFVWPLPSVPPASLVLRPTAALGGLSLNSKWATAMDSTVIARTSAPTHISARTCVPIEFSRQEPPPLDRSARAGLDGQRIEVELHVRALTSAAQPWIPSKGAGALVRPDTASELKLCFRSLGTAGSPYLYRADLKATGVPGWLQHFDAPQHPDSTRTYGLRYLFEAPRQASQNAPRVVGRLYVVAN